MTDMHARELAVARHGFVAVQQAAAELRQGGRPSGGPGGLWRGSGRRGGANRARPSEEMKPRGEGPALSTRSTGNGRETRSKADVEKHALDAQTTS